MRKAPLWHLLDLIFPPPPDVLAALRIREEDIMRHFSLTKIEKRAVYAGLPYRESAVRALIRANKFHRDLHSARVLGAVLREMLIAIEEEHARAGSWSRAAVVPMPASPARLRERGVNQVERIVRNMPEHFLESYAYEPNILKREHRESQVRVPKEKRFLNVRNAFYVPRADLVREKDILLIDDVVESGATMADAARALRAAGARNIIGAALAH